jgi:ribonuclease HI
LGESLREYMRCFSKCCTELPGATDNDAISAFQNGATCSVMKEGAGVGLVLISPLGVRMEYWVRLHFSGSNNAAKYEALINDLRIAVELGIKRLEIRETRSWSWINS